MPGRHSFRPPVMSGGHHRRPEISGAGAVRIMGSPGGSIRSKPLDRICGPGNVMMTALKNRNCTNIIIRGNSDKN